MKGDESKLPKYAQRALEDLRREANRLRGITVSQEQTIRRLRKAEQSSVTWQREAVRLRGLLSNNAVSVATYKNGAIDLDDVVEMKQGSNKAHYFKVIFSSGRELSLHTDDSMELKEREMYQQWLAVKRRKDAK